MQKKYRPGGAALDTLARSGTKPENDAFPVLENRTEQSDKKTLQKRARAKAFSVPVAVGLVEASEKTDGKKISSYWRSYHCSSVASVHEDGKVTSKYCKTRWCVVCNRIRTAKVIKQYLPDVTGWMEEDEVYFVTLTAPNVVAGELREELVRMKKTFSRIAGAAKKQFQRGQRARFIALRKLECTYSLKRNDFNPHIHALIKGQENAQYVLNEWLNRNESADRRGQHLRKVDGAGGMMEVFKYSAKMITKVGNSRKVYLDSLHKIFVAFDGIKTLQPYGFKCSNIDAEVTEEERTNAAVLKEYEWDQKQTDWINTKLDIDHETGELLGVSSEGLTGYKPSEDFNSFIQMGFVLRRGQSWHRPGELPWSPFGDPYSIEMKKLPDQNPYGFKRVYRHDPEINDTPWTTPTKEKEGRQVEFKFNDFLTKPTLKNEKLIPQKRPVDSGNKSNQSLPGKTEKGCPDGRKTDTTGSS